MPTDILLPILGESITQAVLHNWLKQSGDLVKQGEVIAELETEKATLELESPENGILETILVQAGETVVTGQRLALVARSGESERPLPSPELAMIQPEPESEGPLVVLEPTLPRDRKISPAARKRARELGVEIELVRAHTSGERVTSQDVESYASLQTSRQEGLFPISSHHIVMSDIRKVTARRMAESAHDIPQYSVSIDVEMDRFNHVLEVAQEKVQPSGVKVTVTALLLYLTCRAIRQHGLVNSRYDLNRIEVMDTINLAIAMRTPDGLVAPVIFHAEELTLTDISRRLKDLTNRARNGSLSLNEMTNSTFSISNLGMYGITQFTPLINPPQAAILGIGAIRQHAFPIQAGGSCFRSVLTLTLTADHRVLDGADSAEFLATLRDEIEHSEITKIIL
jgi:pyruvate dehydrogenase E2 component (dihydrolipoamide acetyltransferase)